MVSVPLCTKLEMSDKGSPWASSIATLYHPPVRNEELRLSFLLAHSVANGEKRSVILLTGEALRGDTGFAGVFGPQNEGHKFTRKCILTLDTSMAKPTPRPLLRMVEREEYLECLGASVERPV